jgi:hypothetical protein
VTNGDGNGLLVGKGRKVFPRLRLGMDHVFEPSSRFKNPPKIE